MSFEGNQIDINSFIMGRIDFNVRVLEALATYLPEDNNVLERMIDGFHDTNANMSPPYKAGIEQGFEKLFGLTSTDLRILEDFNFAGDDTKSRLDAATGT